MYEIKDLTSFFLYAVYAVFAHKNTALKYINTF